MTMGSRIVVMKDGIIQQVDSPANLYMNPCNMFVAGFIGSPQMNFVNAKVAKRADGIWLEFGKSAVKLPEGRAASLDNSYIGKEVIMGIRPENVHDEESYLSTMPDSIVDADVEITEMMGAETYLYLMIEGTQFVARVNPRSTVKPNDKIKVALEGNKIHLFDKDTEMAILN